MTSLVKVVKETDDTVTLECTCPICKDRVTIDMPAGAYTKWRTGTCIQNAWPEADLDTRERLISGICPDCW